MKRCAFCDFSSNGAAEFEQHMVVEHAWGKEVTPDQSSKRFVGGRPGRWWRWFGIACLLFIVGLGKSGGGLGPSQVCEPLRGLLVAGTLLALLAAAILFVVAAVASTLRAAERYARPASGEGPEGAVPALRRGETLGKESSASGILGLLRRRWISPLGVATIGLAAAVLFAPSGCAPYRFCTQADRPIAADSTADGLRFAGELPEPRQQGRRDDDNTVYTAIFDAVAPWQMTWKTTADQIRLDVFASDAVQTGAYFSLGSDGHLDVLFGGPEGLETINRTGSFCVRIDLIDRKFQEALSSHYAVPRTGPTPKPRPLSWTLTIRQ